MDILRGINRQTSVLRVSAQRTAELKRVRQQMESAEAASQKLTAQIGQAYLASLESGDTAPLEPLCASMAQLREDMAHLTERVAQLTGHMYCSACGQERRGGDRFCPGCGQRFEEDAPPAESAADKARNVYISWPKQPE